MRKRRRKNKAKKPKPPSQTPKTNHPSLSPLASSSLQAATPTHAKRPSIFAGLWKSILGGMTIVVTFVGIYGLLTNFTSIVAGDPLRRSPLSAPLTVTNTSSLFTLTEVAPTCYINTFDFTNNSHLISSELGGYQRPIERLAPGDTDTIYCFGDDSNSIGWMGKTFASADVSIQVAYGLGVNVGGVVVPIPFVVRSYEKRLRTASTGDGKLKWLPWGLHDLPVPPPRAKPVTGP